MLTLTTSFDVDHACKEVLAYVGNIFMQITEKKGQKVTEIQKMVNMFTRILFDVFLKLLYSI